MIRKASCVQRKAPVRLVSITDVHLLEVEVLERHRGRGHATFPVGVRGIESRR
jgi:hypothetical protein